MKNTRHGSVRTKHTSTYNVTIACDYDIDTFNHVYVTEAVVV